MTFAAPVDFIVGMAPGGSLVGGRLDLALAPPLRWSAGDLAVASVSFRFSPPFFAEGDLDSVMGLTPRVRLKPLCLART